MRGGRRVPKKSCHISILLASAPTRLLFLGNATHTHHTHLHTLYHHHHQPWGKKTLLSSEAGLASSCHPSPPRPTKGIEGRSWRLMCSLRRQAPTPRALWLLAARMGRCASGMWPRGAPFAASRAFLKPGKGWGPCPSWTRRASWRPPAVPSTSWTSRRLGLSSGNVWYVCCLCTPFLCPPVESVLYLFFLPVWSPCMHAHLIHSPHPHNPTHPPHSQIHSGLPPLPGTGRH